MVKSEKVYSPQNYLEIIIGKSYMMGNSDNDIEFIEGALKYHGFDDLWNYPLTEIDHIVEENLDVVLVDCLVWNSDKSEYEHVYRWFEVPDNFMD